MPATIISSSVGNNGVRGPNLVCDIPAAIAGDLFVLIVNTEAGTAPPAPAGWTRVPSSNRNANLAIYTRTADGSEGPTVVFALHPSTGKFYGFYYCAAIRDWQGSIAFPYPGGTQGPQQGCPENVFPWGSATPTLVLAICGWRCGGAIPSGAFQSYPADYADAQGVSEKAEYRGMGIAGCARTIAADSEQPSNFVFTNTVAGTTHTIAVQGA